MPDTLTVSLNEDAPQSIAVPRSFETTGDFDVVFENHGAALHVHVHLDPTLSGIATVATPNRYVEEGATRRVRVEVSDGDRPVEGRLEVVTGYGAHTGYVSVTVRDPDVVDPGVDVDERLGQPQSDSTGSGVDPDRVLPLSVAAVASLLALGAAVVTEDLFVTLGVLVVLVGVGVAWTLLAA